MRLDALHAEGHFPREAGQIGDVGLWIRRLLSLLAAQSSKDCDDSLTISSRQDECHAARAAHGSRGDCASVLYRDQEFDSAGRSPHRRPLSGGREGSCVRLLINDPGPPFIRRNA